jgi:hypothetical protein
MFVQLKQDFMGKPAGERIEINDEIGKTKGRENKGDIHRFSNSTGRTLLSRLVA